jgi:hypothetical protein
VEVLTELKWQKTGLLDWLLKRLPERDLRKTYAIDFVAVFFTII